ncbi:MAG: hypothetical protein DCC58_01360 [Chloroflexi bacterium]|nr:MAG: hypothetical protein DCC58_01360 [Chloroflexota bacterium]
MNAQRLRRGNRLPTGHGALEVGHATDQQRLPPETAASPPVLGQQPDQPQAARADSPDQQYAFERLHVFPRQAKLTVNQPHDQFEQEADALAEALPFSSEQDATRPDDAGAGRMHPTRSFRISSVARQTSAAPGSADANVGSDSATVNHAADVTATVESGISGGGQPLDDATRSGMEQHIGHDFRQVRVYADARAAASAAAIDARAYTVGNRIVFGAGEYRPETPSGRRLLTHELTHVVQQGMATPLASAPGVQRWSGSALVQREPKDNKPYPGPAPANPFPAPPDGKTIDVTQLVTSSMQSLTSDMVNHAYTSYVNAVTTVKGRIQAEKKEEEERQKATRELVLGAVLLPLGMVAPAVGTAAMGAVPTVRNTLMKRLEANMPALLKANGIDATHAMWATAQAGHDLDGLIEKVTAEKIAKQVEGLGDKAKGAASKVSLNGGPFDQAMAFLDACAYAADQNSKALMQHVFVTTDFGELLGIYSTFSNASLEVYTADLDGRAHNFMTQLSQNAGKVESIVVIDAYGRDRLAKVRYNTTSANYFFIAWITPDMEPIARQLEPNPARLSPRLIVNHLPAPMLETGERIVMMDAWGRDRYALVHVTEGVTGAGRADQATQYHFIKWYAPNEEVLARTKGAQQIGGVNRLRPDQVKNLRAPES